MARVFSILRSLFALFIGGSLIEMLLTGESYLIAGLRLGSSEQIPLLLSGAVLVGGLAGLALGSVAPKAPVVHSGLLAIVLIIANLFQSEANGVAPLWYEWMLGLLIVGLLLGAAFWPYREHRLNRSMEH